MSKFTELYNQMTREHNELFTEFKTIHDNFKADKDRYRDEFNKVGKKVLEIMQDYEQRLCGGMERGQFGKFSDKVAEKFWTRVKKDFSHIELVGVEIIKTK